MSPGADGRPGSVTAAPADVTDLEVVRERLWGAVVDVDEYAAAGTVFASLDAGVAPETVLLEVIGPVQRRVGSEWAAGRLTVAQEHAATAINDRVIAAMAHHPASRVTATLARVAVACVDGEWHALPARLLAEVLRLRGYRVDFLGAQVPTPHLIAHLHQINTTAVALSASIPTRLPTAHAAISACQSVGVPVLVGGAAFGRDGRYARLLGADGWAQDAPGAAAMLAGGLARPHPDQGRQAVEGLPHLSDQEYTMVAQTATSLVRTTLAGLEERIPRMRSYTDQERQHTAEDLAHIVDFLSIALYTDDDELFTGFMGWTAQILSARSVPPTVLHPALDLLTEQLNDFPRATRALRAAHRTLDSADPLPPAPGRPT